MDLLEQATYYTEDDAPLRESFEYLCDVDELLFRRRHDVLGCEVIA